MYTTAEALKISLPQLPNTNKQQQQQQNEQN